MLQAKNTAAVDVLSQRHNALHLLESITEVLDVLHTAIGTNFDNYFMPPGCQRTTDYIIEDLWAAFAQLR